MGARQQLNGFHCWVVACCVLGLRLISTAITGGIDAKGLLIDPKLKHYDFHVYRKGIGNHDKVVLISLYILYKYGNFILIILSGRLQYSHAREINVSRFTRQNISSVDMLWEFN